MPHSSGPHQLAPITSPLTCASLQVCSIPLTLTHIRMCVSLHTHTLSVLTCPHACMPLSAHTQACTLGFNHSFPVFFHLLWLHYHFVFALFPSFSCLHPFLPASANVSLTLSVLLSPCFSFYLCCISFLGLHHVPSPGLSLSGDPLGWVQLTWALPQPLPHWERCLPLPHCPCGCRLFHLPLDLKLKLHIKRIMHL